ncbi:MAG: sigma-70 family RNA polymerase sigma factor [Bacteroidaceae bacterium]|nr:sigma-70 family RNA polymerase sigma factor [Bacteroidaceae bacterium]
MAKRKHYYDEEYDADNYAYQDYDDDEDDIDDLEEDLEDDDTKRQPLDTPTDDDDSAEPPEFNPDDHIHMDLPSEQKSFNPADYDFTQIMEDYNSGDEKRRAYAIEQAVYAMDALVKYVINRHYPTYREKHYEDMLQTGRMAIVETLGGYTGKCAPSSYFYTTIRHEIQVFVAEDVHRTTRHYAAMANKIRKAEIALAQIDGKEHHDDLTISVYTGLPLTTVIETRRQTLAADFVELNPNIDADESVVDDYGNPAAAYWKQERANAVSSAINRLSPIEAQVIRLMYGMDGESPCNPPEIARRLHLKTDQVRKISQDACRKLGNDKKLMRDIGTNDQLTVEKERASTAMPFVPVVFGGGANFFDEISEEDSDDPACESIADFFKPMTFAEE